jgi:hypothetical protein
LTAVAASTATWVFILLPLLVVWTVGVVDILGGDLPRGTKPVVGTLAYFLLRKPTAKEIRFAQEAAADHGRELHSNVTRRLTGEE